MAARAQLAQQRMPADMDDDDDDFWDEMALEQVKQVGGCRWCCRWSPDAITYAPISTSPALLIQSPSPILSWNRCPRICVTWILTVLPTLMMTTR